MTNEYQRWLREREIEQAAVRGVQAPPQQRATIESDVAVPTLQALAIGAVGGLAAGTVTLLVSFGSQGWGRLWLAGQVCAGGFVFVLTGCTVAFVLEHRRWIREPLDILWERLQAALSVAHGRPDDVDDPSYVVVRGHTPAMLPETIDHEVKTIEPPVDRETKRLYDFIIRVWPTGKISRRHCGSLGFSRKTWEKYVGGQRGKAGQESGRGLLDRAGVVAKGPNGWEIVATLEAALQVTDKLAEYAAAKAQLVAGRDGLGVGRSKDVPGVGLPQVDGVGDD
jgi:hypothetical protein